MTKLNPIITTYDAQGVSVLDIRTLPEEVKCEIMTAAFSAAAQFGNGGTDGAEWTVLQEALETLSKATDRTATYMFRLPKIAGDL